MRMKPPAVQNRNLHRPNVHYHHHTHRLQFPSSLIVVEGEEEADYTAGVDLLPLYSVEMGAALVGLVMVVPLIWTCRCKSRYLMMGMRRSVWVQIVYCLERRNHLLTVPQNELELLVVAFHCWVGKWKSLNLVGTRVAFCSDHFDLLRRRRGDQCPLAKEELVLLVSDKMIIVDQYYYCYANGLHIQSLVVRHGFEEWVQ